MERRALLIFADAASRDCTRRGWPSAFRILPETQSIRFEACGDFDPHLFTSKAFRRQVAPGTLIHFQEGASFGDRLQNAIETVAQLGYQEIVVIGQDCPDLEAVDIRRAFELLDTYRAVIGPDQNGGCYLIGIHASDRSKLRAIPWQQNTDFRELSSRFLRGELFTLPVKIDLDTLEDIWLLASSKSPFRWVALGLLEALIMQFLLENDCTAPLFAGERISWQLPPPRVH
jgi:glycosyltransferase A (GT-A) superfamily protein (DUF2064 family)